MVAGAFFLWRCRPKFSEQTIKAKRRRIDSGKSSSEMQAIFVSFLLPSARSIMSYFARCIRCGWMCASEPIHLNSIGRASGRSRLIHLSLQSFRFLSSSIHLFQLISFAGRLRKHIFRSPALPRQTERDRGSARAEEMRFTSLVSQLEFSVGSHRYVAGSIIAVWSLSYRVPVHSLPRELVCVGADPGEERGSERQNAISNAIVILCGGKRLEIIESSCSP